MKLSFRDILEEIIFICSMKIISLKFAEKTNVTRKLSAKKDLSSIEGRARASGT